ncbi:MAG TPA: DUF4982 domain-containing protein [Marinilabiliaceae bacterium]|nr:DUF4982 domain-containing protein [Marinilabiliaceae bacterium]
MQNYNDETGVIFWDIPYSEGELKVIGLDANNKEVSSYEIRSSSQPYALKIISEEQTIDKEGVAQVIVQVFDKDGIPVMLSDNEVTCDISNGELLGLEGSNNSDMSNYTDNKHRVYHGRIIAFIKPSDDKANDIRVRFTSPWLKSAETTIKIK